MIGIIGVACLIATMFIAFTYWVDKEPTQYVNKADLQRRVYSAKSLTELFNIHREMAELGICINSGPCKYGIVRVDTLQYLAPSNIYLGNIYGIWTHTLPYWEQCTDKNAYSIVLQQYKDLLISDLRY